ncbi:MAG TPA: extracellular solute-binding protein [Candidatus Paceibacterota bacterium]|nr:extracellular solute-binding protein [Candidatus Paceibacterota bacterium]
MSAFQIMVLGIFSTLILVGIGVFAIFGGVFGPRGIGDVEVWGTLEEDIVRGTLEALRAQDRSLESVRYIEKDPATYKDELINAMAAAQGPDLALISAEDLLSFSDKIVTIPYSVIAQGSFLATYIDEAQIFLTPQGELALPFVVDPVVMYWNRDLFASAGIASPPKYWNELLTIAPKITSLDARSSVTRSAVALGEWRNIGTAKEMLATLFMQAGDNIAVRAASGEPEVVFGASPQGSVTNPAESALRFYTEFANPTKTSYSWNRALPDALTMFTAGDLGVYFGFASEYSAIKARNPNLRFAAAVVPQIEGNNTRVVYGYLIGLAIPKSSNNIQGALMAAQSLTSKSGISLISGALSLPPVRRDVSVDTSGDAVAGAFVNSALISRGWLDPSPRETDQIFRSMIESVVSGALTPAAAINEGSRSLQDLFPR